MRQKSHKDNHLRKILLCLLLAGLLTGCAVLRTPGSFDPPSINEVRFRDRVQSKADQDLRVSVAVPTAEEVKQLFQVDLIRREIQPVWIKVENHSDQTYYLIASGTDPNHYSPLETAYAAGSRFLDFYRDEMGDYYRSMNLRNPILPNTAVSGFIYTNLDEGEKVVNVDLIAEEATGDPANLVIIGDFKDIAAAFARQGWLPAEETYASAVWKTIKSFLFGSRYRYSPVSPLYYFGRHQDLARQKPRHNIHERNHLRLWYSPYRYQDKPVFIGQISRDIGVRFTLKASPPVTHKIDPDIDEARHSLVEDLLFSQMLAKVGWVKGVGMTRSSRPRYNLTGDPYYTDGYRVVLFLDKGPIALNQVKSINWESPQNFHVGPAKSD
ncbi:MAG: LssY C-terminal domain-containing protein [Desulfuromonadales bacterium]